MKILFLTLGKGNPSTRFRVLQWVPALQARGYQVTVRHCWPPVYYNPPLFRFKGGRRLYNYGRLLISLFQRLYAIRDAAQFDVVFLQRELMGLRFQFVERQLYTRARKVIFD